MSVTQNINTLREDILNCSKCTIMVESRKDLMGDNHYAIPFTSGTKADIMLIGIAPGRLKFDRDPHEKIEYVFKMGSGKILERLFNDCSLDKERLHITNICKCTTPKDKKFDPYEVQTCVERFLKTEIQCINPKIIIVLGRQAEKYFEIHFPDTEYHYMNHPSRVLQSREPYEPYLEKFREIIEDDSR